MKKIILLLTFLIFTFFSVFSWASSRPVLSSGYTIDFDNYGVVLYGKNFDSSSYVDIRSVDGDDILMSIGPPDISFLPGSVSDALLFRINDVALQKILGQAGLRFYVVSPTSNYQFAGPVTVFRGSPSFVSQPALFHSVYFRPAQGSFWAMLADDTGSPSPREQAIWSVNNNLQALRASGFDTVTVILPDSDGWASQHGGGFSYDPINNPSAQRAVGQEIFLRIAAANHLKVIFVITPNLYRESSDGRPAWAGLADQYDVSPQSNGSLDFIHSLIDPTPYYGTPSTTKLYTIGLEDGPIRQYFNDVRVAGFILAPELNPGVVSSQGVATHEFYFNKYWNWFYNLVHYDGAQVAFAGAYLLGSPPQGVSSQIDMIKKFKSWFRPGGSNKEPDMIGVECYGGDGYPLQNVSADMSLIFDAMTEADGSNYPGDFSISPRKVFIAEGNTSESSNAFTNQFYNRMMLLASRRLLGGIQWFASDTFSDGVPPITNNPDWQLYNTRFTPTGVKVFASVLSSGKVWHNVEVGGSYADPTTWSAYTDNFPAQWGTLEYTSPTPKGYWFGQAIHDFSEGRNVSAFAYPNPAQGNGSGTASTTIYWDATVNPLITAVEVHFGSPSGTLVGSGASAGSVPVGAAADGSLFYIQDVSNGKALTSANTLSEVYVNVQ